MCCHDDLKPRVHSTLFMRLLWSVEKVRYNGDECWEHQGRLNKPSGYPYVNVRVPGQGHKSIAAHAIMYEIAVAAVPAGHEIDHTCHNHRCVNPDHLQAIPRTKNRQMNYRRGPRARIRS